MNPKIRFAISLDRLLNKIAYASKLLTYVSKNLPLEVDFTEHGLHHLGDGTKIMRMLKLFRYIQSSSVNGYFILSREQEVCQRKRVMVVSQQIQQAIKQATNPAHTIDLLNVWAANLRHIDLAQAWKINYQAEYHARNGMFTHTPYYQGLVECWYWRGKFYSVHKKYAEALSCFYQALEFCDYVNPSLIEHENQAADYYQDAPDQFIDNWVDKMALHNILGVTLALQSQLDAALEHYLIAEEIAITTHNEWMQTILNQ